MDSEVDQRCAISPCPKPSSGGAVWFPLWEWLLSGPSTSGLDLTKVSAHKADQEWWVYGEEHNEAIELAYQSGLEQCEVSIGIRTYIIFFDGRRVRQSGRRGMVQKDKFSLKTRDVRRRLVSRSEKEAAFIKAFRSSGCTSDDRCALCCELWATNPAVPVLRIPGCGHSFHAPCAQYLADGCKACPLCRMAVSWSEIEFMNKHVISAQDNGGMLKEKERRVGEDKPLHLRNDSGMWLLVFCQRGDVRAVERSLRCGVPVDTRSPKNATPLMTAAMMGRKEVVKCLLAARADVHLHTDAGKTALSLAQDHGHWEVELMLSQAANLPFSL